MFTIKDGKRKIIFNYKTAESIISKTPKYVYPNYLTSYIQKFYDNPESNLQLKLCNNKINKDKSSRYFINKSKQLQKLQKEIQTKKLDVLINKALEKSNSIRDYYNGHKFNKLNNSLNININLIGKKSFNKTNTKFPKIKVDNNELSIPKFAKERIKDNIMNKVNYYFPEKYFNIKENDDDNYNDKSDLKSKLKNRKKEEEYKKLYSIKYISPGPIKQDSKEMKFRKKEYRLIGPAITIYNKTNKKQLFSSSNSNCKNNNIKKIDVGLNTNTYFD
jgi:hypothetical protein